ncbi:MAG TPA: four helix bundle protein [Candidatus Binatia bacterium]|nr:four helix bundle protein [Candidatus Binatia bacterium]
MTFGGITAIIKSFRELDVYVLARKQAKAIFALSKCFPNDEKYSLTDQIRRSSRAVNAMIAEAWARRRYPAAFINKIDEALGEAMETQAWLDHALDCGYVDRNQYRTLDDSWQKVGAMLNRTIQRADDFCRSASR